MPGVDVVTPAGMEELVGALARATTRSRLLAGGTDLVRAIRRPGQEPDLLIDLSHLPSCLRASRRRTAACRRDDHLHTAAVRPLVREHASCLGQAAAQVGSVQIRNIATIAGNIANASPCADGATALMALDADVTTIDGDGHSVTRPLSEVLLGPGTHESCPDQAITEFSFAALGAEHRSAFAKIGSRTAVTVARLSMALVVRFDVFRGVLADVRVSLGAVGETAFRDPRRSRPRRADPRTRSRPGSSRTRAWPPCSAPSPGATRCRTSSTPCAGWPTTPGTRWRWARRSSPPGTEGPAAQTFMGA